MTPDDAFVAAAPHVGSTHNAEPADLIPIILDDGTLAPAEKMDVHRRGLLHLAISIFVFVEDRLLIQRRAAQKYHCGGLWANTCCTHPHWGEDTIPAASRRLKEELGLAATLQAAGELTYRADVGRGMVEHEHVKIFYGALELKDLALAPSPREVSGIRLVTVAQLRAEARRDPGKFAPWLLVYLERWSELRLPY